VGKDWGMAGGGVGGMLIVANRWPRSAVEGQLHDSCFHCGFARNLWRILVGSFALSPKLDPVQIGG